MTETHTPWQRGRRAGERGVPRDIPNDLTGSRAAMWLEGYDSCFKSVDDVVSVVTCCDEHDPINHPAHYTSHPSGVEAIEITRWLRGPYSNACKYVMRGWEGLKGDPIEDLRKAIWYLNDADKYPDDTRGLPTDADMRWQEYYEGETRKEKRECLACIILASELEAWDKPPTDTIHSAKKLIQDRIAYLQSHPDVAL